MKVITIALACIKMYDP